MSSSSRIGTRAGISGHFSCSASRQSVKPFLEGASFFSGGFFVSASIRHWTSNPTTRSAARHNSSVPEFPDELLKDSSRVARALRNELGKAVGLFVMADTAYGSCCVDEVGALHVDANCVVHYGHACLSPTSSLPALFVFGKASIDVKHCVESLCQSFSRNKPVLVMYGLECARALQSIKDLMSESLSLDWPNQMLYYVEVTCSSINPSGNQNKNKEHLGSHRMPFLMVNCSRRETLR